MSPQLRLTFLADFLRYTSFEANSVALQLSKQLLSKETLLRPGSIGELNTTGSDDPETYKYLVNVEIHFGMSRRMIQGRVPSNLDCKTLWTLRTLWSFNLLRGRTTAQTT